MKKLLSCLAAAGQQRMGKWGGGGKIPGALSARVRSLDDLLRALERHGGLRGRAGAQSDTYSKIRCWVRVEDGEALEGAGGRQGLWGSCWAGRSSG